MAMLESTPYRVYYLINCPENTPDFRFIWGLDVDRTADVDGPGSCQTNRYTSVVATLKDPNDFSSAVVEAMDVIEMRMYNRELDIMSEQTSYQTYPVMPWNDIDQRIVDMIDAFYAKDDNKGRRKRQVDYADRIQELFENPESVKVSIDDHGHPHVDIRGLPYLYTGGRSECAIVSIKSDPYMNDYEYTIDMGSSYYEPVTFTGVELHNYISQSKKYQEIDKVMSELLGYDDSYDDWDD